jgi:hypothetical protein
MEKTMKLLTQANKAKLFANAKTSEHDENHDPVPVVKLFTPWANCTWLLTELEENEDIAFGLCDLGMGSPEIGSVDLSEITAIQGPAGLRIERDLHFKGDKLLSEYTADARIKGYIAA